MKTMKRLIINIKLAHNKLKLVKTINISAELLQPPQ